MNDTVSKRVSFLRETLRDMVAFAKAEWQWIVVFAAIIAIEQRVSFLNYNLQEITDQIKQAQGDTPKLLEIARQYMPNVVFSVIASLVTAAISTYIFTVLYLRRIVQNNAPDFAPKNFIYWLFKISQKYLILVFPLILLGIVLSILLAQKPSDTVQAVAVAAFAGLSCLWMFYFYFGLYLYYLVSPLAAMRVKEPILKTSANMTRKHLMRIWWESMIVLGIIYVAFFPLVLVNFGVTQSYGADSFEVHVFSALITGVMESVTGVAMAVYACVVCRILFQEQRNNPA